MMYLGFIINSRSMTVSWPLYKRTEIYHELLPFLTLPKNKRHMAPKQTASVLGKLRSAIQISPWGVYLSFALATNLKQAGRHSMSSQRFFWSKGKVRLNKAAVRDISLLLETLLAPEEDPLWTRPIALLVPRESTHWLKSDASYAGIGGWTLSLGTFMCSLRLQHENHRHDNRRAHGSKRDRSPYKSPRIPGRHHQFVDCTETH
jgi:hypothetical protein